MRIEYNSLGASVKIYDEYENKYDGIMLGASSGMIYNYENEFEGIMFGA